MKPRLVPALDWLARYEGAWLRADVMAGLTTAAVVIPKAMAYATIAGLPVQIGLYTAFVPMVVYALLGTLAGAERQHDHDARASSARPRSADAAPSADPRRSSRHRRRSRCSSGAIVLLAARLLRLGFVANFISEPVLTGFKAGIGLVIVRRPGAEAARRPHRQGRMAPRRASRSSATCRRRTSATLVVGARDARGRGRARALRPALPAPLMAVGRRHRRVALPRPRRPRVSPSSATSRAACPRSCVPELVARRSRSGPRRVGHRAHELHRDDRGRRARSPSPSEPRPDRQPGARRDRRAPTCWAGSSARCPPAAARPRRRSTARPARARRPRRSSPRA